MAPEATKAVADSVDHLKVYLIVGVSLFPVIDLVFICIDENWSSESNRYNQYNR